MPAKKRVLMLCIVFCLLVGSLLACDVIPSVSFNGTPVTAPPGVGGTSLPLDTWTEAKPGVEMRYSHWKSMGDSEDTMIITRFDPHKVHITVGYQPNKPMNLGAWMKQTGALAVFNGGYFLDNNHASALVISNGQVHGTSYTDGGGMLSVDTQGNISIRYLPDQPYDPTEQLQQATQSRPMLMLNGKRTQFQENAAAKRRTIVAIDKQGRLLVIISPSQAFSLDEIADLLVQHTELGIQDALNLDGGSSTGIYFNTGDKRITLDAITPLPLVITIQ